MNLADSDDAIKAENAEYTNLHLSDLESNILDLYDRLQRLNLEMAHLSAQSSTQNSSQLLSARDPFNWRLTPSQTCPASK